MVGRGTWHIWQVSGPLLGHPRLGWDEIKFKGLSGWVDLVSFENYSPSQKRPFMILAELLS